MVAQIKDFDKCREMYRRAVNSVTDYAEAICQVCVCAHVFACVYRHVLCLQDYMQFELENGTLDQIYIASSRIDQALARAALRRAQVGAVF